MAVGGPSTQQDLDELVTVARRANVAIYFINPAPQSLFNFSMARAIAEDTDGMNILTNDFALNLTKLMEHQTGYYMLGYRSTAGEVGRKEREIRVRTSAKGVELDIRRLYDPVPPDAAEMMRNPPPPVERTEVQKAMDSLARIDTDGPSTVVAEQRTGFVEITVELPARTAVEEPWRKGADVVVTLRDDNAVDIVSASGSIPAGERSARFAVVPPDTRIPRRVSVMITRDGRTMHDAVAISPASPFAAPLVFRAASPPRAPYLPAAIMQFDRTERIRVEWTMPATMTEPVVRLLNAASKELASDLVQTVVPAGPEPARLRADLRPVSLAIGDYALEASGEFDGVRVKHILAIRVVR
jgi:hypothetical protein